MIGTVLEVALLGLLACAAAVTGWLYVGARRGGRPGALPMRAQGVILGLTSAIAALGLFHPALPRVHYLWSFDVGGGERSLGIGLLLDRPSLMMLAVVAFIGLVVHRYAHRYLLGEPGQARFHAHLSLATLSVALLVLSANLAMFVVCWVGVGLALHALLTHYGHRPRARVAARKKFLVSRLGDLALVAACLSCLDAYGTLDLRELARLAAAPDAPVPTLAGLAFALAAMCKSAQVPFHTWLPDSLEAPTPVSAFLHAGIVNGGGYLLVRVSPLLAQAELALAVLVVVGTLTVVVGLLASWAQTDLKRSLAWSTVGQMGFTILQCGLGAFGPALLHLAGHGLYKAHAFLRSGSWQAQLERPARPAGALPSVAGLGGGILLGAGVVWLVFLLFGHGLNEVAGGIVLVALLPLALAQFLVPAGATAGRVSWPVRLASLVGYGALVTTFILLAESALADGLGVTAPLGERGLHGAVLQVAVLAVFVGLALLGALLPAWGRRGPLEKLHVHSLNGFYVGMVFDRWVRRLWPDPSTIAEPTGTRRIG